MVVHVRQELQTFVDTAIDLYLIQKQIANHLGLQPLFSARAETQTGGILLKTYSVFYKRLQITNSFGTNFEAWDSLILANIEVPFFLSIPWIQHHNPILNFDPMTIQWRDSSSNVTDRIEEHLDLGSFTQIPTDFQVMQVQLETLDECLEKPTIPMVYRDLANVFPLSNANSLPPHQDEDHAIKLKFGKTPPFGPLY